MPEIPFFSVLIASYNRPEYLSTCLQSIFIGNYEKFEVVVADDCSPEIDKIKKLTARYISYPNFSFYEHKSNMGMVDTWNFLARQAKGEYLLYIGDDDKLKPDSLFNIEKNIFTHNGYDIYGIGYDIIDEQDKLRVTKVAPFFFEITLNSPALLLYEFLIAGIIPFWVFHPFSLCYKREIAEQISYNRDALIGADLLFLFDCLNHSKKIGVIPESLFRWRKVQGNAVSYQNLSSSGDNSILARKNILNILRNKKEELNPAIKNIIGGKRFEKNFYLDPLRWGKLSDGITIFFLFNKFNQKIMRLKQFLVFIKLFNFMGIGILIRMSYQVLLYKAHRLSISMLGNGRD